MWRWLVIKMWNEYRDTNKGVLNKYRIWGSPTFLHCKEPHQRRCLIPRCYSSSTTHILPPSPRSHICTFFKKCGSVFFFNLLTRRIFMRANRARLQHTRHLWKQSTNFCCLKGEKKDKPLFSEKSLMASNIGQSNADLCGH